MFAFFSGLYAARVFAYLFSIHGFLIVALGCHRISLQYILVRIPIYTFLSRLLPSSRPRTASSGPAAGGLSRTGPGGRSLWPETIFGERLSSRSLGGLLDQATALSGTAPHSAALLLAPVV